jgi:hypothetical protein
MSCRGISSLRSKSLISVVRRQKMKKFILILLSMTVFQVIATEKILGTYSTIPISKLEEHLDLKIHNSHLVFKSPTPVFMKIVLEYREEISGKIQYSTLESTHNAKTHEFSYIATDKIEEYEPFKDVIMKKYSKKVSLYHKEIYDKPKGLFSHRGSGSVGQTIFFNSNFLENHSIIYNLGDISTDVDQKQIIFEQTATSKSDDRFVKIYITFSHNKKNS